MKRIIFLISLLTLIGCKCLLPQIPPQYLQANNSCEAYLPNYLQYISVLDNCDNAILTQEPLPGTILSVANPYYKVKITATNIAGSDIEQFDVFLVDVIPEIIWDSIPGDTLPVVDRNTGLIKAFYSLLDYDIKQGHNERFPGDSIILINDTINTIQKYVVWSMEME